MLKRNIYQWHRSLSLMAAIPVILWAGSGFLHPIMTNIRPKVATQILQPVVIDSSKIVQPLEAVLQENHIDSFAAVRLVHIADNWFYQVQLQHNKEPLYLSARNGKLLTAGNWLYAQYLARQFLEGQSGAETHTAATNEPADCCDAASSCVLHVTKGAKVSSVSYITTYTNEYKSINRLLPVYRVDFDRSDGIRIYVETTTDRFAFAMDNKRRLFDRIFTTVHTWGWLDGLGKGKLVIEILLVGLALITTCMGIYIFFTTRHKKIEGHKLSRARGNHRYTAIVIALFTLMFTFSGLYHAIAKFHEDDRAKYFARPVFYTKDIRWDLSRWQATVKKPVVQVQLIKIDTTACWRIQTHSDQASMHKGKMPVGDIMKAAQIPMPAITYLTTEDDQVMVDGEQRYARYLAGLFSGQNRNNIRSVEPVTKFGSEYNFTDKRLPVWKVSYPSTANDRYFIETTTGSLSKHLNTAELAENYSFSFLHKHEFLAWAGKGWKDFSTMFWAVAQIVMVVFGLILYVRRRGRKGRQDIQG